VEHKRKWKDGLCSCFHFGFFHPTLWNAWLCPQVLLGQILMRMNMNWLATSSNSKEGFQKTFRKILIVLIIFSLYDAFMAPPLFELNLNEKGELMVSSRNEYPWHQLFYVLLSLPMSIYGIVIVVKLRAAIREKYGIPNGRFGKMEDFFCICFCNCCAMAQMARQTADYDDEPAACCTPNGMRRVASTDSIVSAV
jgi:Cys-rich protein (TIGR01571 family)